MEIVGEEYRVLHDPAEAAVTFQGTLRLSGLVDYAPIKQLMDDIVTAGPEKVVLDVRRLEFLNSSGIVLLFKFVINLHDLTTGQVVIYGSTSYPWQTRWLNDLKRLVPELHLTMD